MGIPRKSVGKAGQNDKHDVAIVQHLLNEVPDVMLYDDKEMTSPDGAIVVETLVTDGTVRDAMIRRIERFQERVVYMKRPDGLIEPSKKTIRALLGVFEGAGNVTLLNGAAWLSEFHPGSGLKVPDIFDGETGVGSGYLPAGWVVGGLDGRRWIISVTPAASANQEGSVIFMLLDRSGPGGGPSEFALMNSLNPMRGRIGGIYRQRIDAFTLELNATFWKELYLIHQAWIPILETEVIFVAAVFGAATGTGLIFGAVGFGDFILQNRKKFKHWIAIVGALATARSKLKPIAPTLYDKTVDVILKELACSVRPQDVAKLAGMIIGKMGEKWMKGRVNVVFTLFSLVSNVVGIIAGAVGNMIEKNVERAKDTWDKGLRHMASEFQQVGVKLDLNDQIKILQEFQKHSHEIHAITEKLLKDLKYPLSQL
jgi:hypothetical protein